MGNAATTAWTAGEQAPLAKPQRRNLAGACLAHFLHDGYTDQLYALLPVWQAEFGLSYAGLALVRALYSGTMGLLQVPADKFTVKLGARTALAMATFISAAGYFVVALPLGFAGLCVGLMIAGLGSSVQHPRASMLVTSSYGKAARGPLGVYNFAGDLGKATLPALVALSLPFFAWRWVVGVAAVFGVLVGFALLALVPAQPFVAPPEAQTDARGQDGRGFSLLFAIGALDTATRMGYLLFLPFQFHAKGGHEATVGIGLALLFAGGAFGKASCGWLGQRIGVVGSVIVTEAATALLILTTLALPLAPLLVMLPLLGIVLNGTSSILYGTVPELARKGELSRAFALFYTGVIGSGGLAPIAYGAVADHFGRTVGVFAAAMTAAVIIPLVLALRPFLHETEAEMSDDKDVRTGPCHCGAVRFEATLSDGFRSIRRCTCSYCRMRGAVVVMGGVKVLAGKDALTGYRFHSRAVQHFFCSRCGIYTHHQRRSNQTLYAVNVACLAGVSPFDFAEAPVMDGVSHTNDTGKPTRRAGTLRFIPAD